MSYFPRGYFSTGYFAPGYWGDGAAVPTSPGASTGIARPAKRGAGPSPQRLVWDFSAWVKRKRRQLQVLAERRDFPPDPALPDDPLFLEPVSKEVAPLPPALPPWAGPSIAYVLPESPIRELTLPGVREAALDARDEAPALALGHRAHEPVALAKRDFPAVEIPGERRAVLHVRTVRIPESRDAALPGAGPG